MIMIWKFLKRNLQAGKTTQRPSSVEEKVKEGINFTIKTYGETLKDLARYDRGETFSR